MCLIAFAWQAHPRYPLVVAANRDEFFARPTASAAWSDDGERLGGRDLRAGGTWMGVSRDGRFAALTNHRDPSAMRADAPSRGALVDGFLQSDAPAETALARLSADAARYNGFNLIAAQWGPEPAGLWVVASPGEPALRRVEPGVHALSNARLDTPWPKADAARAALETALESEGDVDHLTARLFSLLGDRLLAPDDRLPTTGVPLDTERALSAAFIRMPGYGTRASTVFVVEHDGRATFVERRCEPDVPVDERRFAFEPSAARCRPDKKATGR